MLKNESRQDHDPSALVLKPALGIKVLDSCGHTFVVRGYSRHLTVRSQVQVTRLQRYRNGGVERGSLALTWQP